MAIDSEFCQKLMSHKEHLEEMFDQSKPVFLSLCFQMLEVLQDYSWRVSDGNPSELQIFRHHYYAVSVQNFWASLLLARSGLYSQAYGVLRSALESGLRWEVLGKHDDILQEEYNRFLGKGKNGREKQSEKSKSFRKFEGLRKLAEPNPWFEEGLACLYDVMSSDVHINRAFLKTYVPLTKTGEPFVRCDESGKMNDTPEKVRIEMFGTHALQAPLCSPEEFMAIWRRVAQWPASLTAEEDPVMKDRLGTVCPPLDETPSAVKVDLLKLGEVMWKWDPKRSPFEQPELDLAPGRIQGEVGEAQVRLSKREQNYDVENLEYKISRAERIPICKDDPIIIYKHTGHIPIPRCSLRMKRDFMNHFADEKLDETQLKEYNKRQKAKGGKRSFSLREAEEFLQDKTGEAWDKAKDKVKRDLAKEWLDIWKVAPIAPTQSTLS